MGFLEGDDRFQFVRIGAAGVLLQSGERRLRLSPLTAKVIEDIRTEERHVEYGEDGLLQRGPLGGLVEARLLKLAPDGVDRAVSVPAGAVRDVGQGPGGQQHPHEHQADHGPDRESAEAQAARDW